VVLLVLVFFIWLERYSLTASFFACLKGRVFFDMPSQLFSSPNFDDVITQYFDFKMKGLALRWFGEPLDD